MNTFSPDMRALAKAVLETEDVEGARALADCITESVNNPTFPITVAHVERVEGLLRKWKRILTSRLAEAVGDDKVELEQYVVDLMLLDYYKLQLDTRQSLYRELG